MDQNRNIACCDLALATECNKYGAMIRLLNRTAICTISAYRFTEALSCFALYSEMLAIAEYSMFVSFVSNSTTVVISRRVQHSREFVLYERVTFSFSNARDCCMNQSKLSCICIGEKCTVLVQVGYLERNCVSHVSIHLL